MPNSAERRSPVYGLLQMRGAQWGRLGDAEVALRFGSEEEAALRTLGLCDLSGLEKLGVKGAGAEAWLRQRGVDVPGAIYETKRLSDGGLIARLGSADFFLEAGPTGGLLPGLVEALAQAPQVYRVERHDAAFLLAGSRARAVLAQVCSIDFRTAAPGRLILTRAAGVSCAVLPEEAGEVPRFRLWVDPSYAVSFWETLAEISDELGGKVVGLACVYPDLLVGGGT